MSSRSAITIDVGTTNCKLSLFDVESLELLDRLSFKTPKYQDNFGDLFNFDLIFSEIQNYIKHVLVLYPETLESVIISSVGEAGVLVDEDGQIASSLIAWYDKRSKCYIEQLSEEAREKIYDVTGLPAHSNYSISKIKWLIDNQVDSHKQYTWLNIPDLIAFMLTGNQNTEYTMASRTMCYDIENRVWSQDILTLFNIDNVDFPEVVTSGQPVGHILPTLFEEELQNILVYIAGHDHMVGATGVDLHNGDILNSTGTTEAILKLSQANQNTAISANYQLSNGIYTDGNFFTLFTSLPTGGSAAQWFTNLFDISLEELSETCNQLFTAYNQQNFDMSDLLFIPHLNGSGAPYKNTNSKALFYGLTASTSKEDLLLAIFVGLALEFRLVLECFDIEKVRKLLVIGPAIKNKLWLQLKADVLSRDIYVINIDEAVSFGALRTVYQNLDYTIQYSKVSPNDKNQEKLNDLYVLYKKMYQAKQHF